MEFWLLVIIGILLIVIVILSIKLFLMRKTAREIESAFAGRLMTDTNILIDISHQDKTMRKLAESLNSELRKLRRERHRFYHGDLELKEAVTNISHDLRTPLTAISGYFDLLEREEKSDAVSRYIEVIKNRIEVMKQLIEELFQYSVVISAEHDLTTEPVFINGFLEESILAFYGALQQQCITPDIDITEKRITRKVNRTALSRVFSNIMSNVIKYSDGDLKITLADTGEITFSNTASALSGIEVERLFDRFYTVERARKSTGLGLSISRILTEQMGGKISAHYRNGKLSISIWLPDCEKTL